MFRQVGFVLLAFFVLSKQSGNPIFILLPKLKFLLKMLDYIKELARPCMKLYWKCRRSPSGKDGWHKKQTVEVFYNGVGAIPQVFWTKKGSGTAICRTTSNKRKISIEHTLTGGFLLPFLGVGGAWQMTVSLPQIKRKVSKMVLYWLVWSIVARNLDFGENQGI